MAVRFNKKSPRHEVHDQDLWKIGFWRQNHVISPRAVARGHEEQKQEPRILPNPPRRGWQPTVHHQEEHVRADPDLREFSVPLG